MEIKDLYDRVLFRIKNQGILSLLKVMLKKTHDFIKPPIPCDGVMKFLEFSINGKGLEIGGPSYIFSKNGFIPIYPKVRIIDNLNFANETIWEGHIASTDFIYKNKLLGKQFIMEDNNLQELENQSYDFIISSEMIQHIANPLSALYEWRRVIKDDGYLLLIIPNMEKTFDHRRQLTTLEHMIADYINNVDESDSTHFEEILKYHDLSRDRLAGNFHNFKLRVENNMAIRAVQHHVFNEKSAIDLVNYAGFEVIDSELYISTVIVIAKKINLIEIDRID